jgi:small subunit ribosomal protein S3
MGQKTHPEGFRLGFVKNWKSQWFSTENYSEFLHEDIKTRRFIKNKLKHGAIEKIVIERRGEDINVYIHSARPGIIIGRKGSEVKELRDELTKMLDRKVNIEIKEISSPELSAQLVAEDIANQIMNRRSYRRAMKNAVSQAMRLGAEGVKIICSGRLGGFEMSRSERVMEGRVPLHTLRADIDYGFSEAHTTAGRIGVKVWIFKGDTKMEEIEKEMEEKKLAEKREERKKKKKTRHRRKPKVKATDSDAKEKTNNKKTEKKTGKKKKPDKEKDEK